MNLALLAAAGVLAGAATETSRFAVAEVPSLTLSLLRQSIGFACLAPFAAQFSGVFGLFPASDGHQALHIQERLVCP